VFVENGHWNQPPASWRSPELSFENRKFWEASELLSQGQNRPLSLGEKFGLKLHLLMCDGCRNSGKQLDFIRAAMKRYLERGGSDRQRLEPVTS
jgi:hypothetical protein